MIQEFLDVINGQEMLSVHGNDDGIPDLRDQNLWLVLDFHITSREDFGVDTLRKASKDVPPRRPNRDTEVERACDRKHRIPNNVPQVGIEEEEDEIGEEHQAEQDPGLVLTQIIRQDLVAAVGDCHDTEDSNGVTERTGKESVRFREFGAKDEDPKTKGHVHVITL
jgi:hypothetical protein